MSFINSEECYTLVGRARHTTQEARDEAFLECDKMQQEEYEAENPPEDDSDSDDENEDLEEEVLEDEEEEEEEEEEIEEIEEIEIKNEVQQAGFGGMGINTVLIISVIGLLLVYAYKTK
tara:strand:- start:1330 stop:1686 length:357 start_codon:yes stop_codon:yes gene_type:complete